MAISLKEQLIQARKLKEVVYHVPKFDTAYYIRAYPTSHKEGRENGRKMFYDFYAMEFLWSFLGSGQLSKVERDQSNDTVSNKLHRFLPASSVKVIDDVYEQVTNATAKALVGYLRAACIQEFRHITDNCYGWMGFRQDIVSHYNIHKTITKDDYNRLVKNNIPGMSKYPDTIQRLLEFSKHYSKMETDDGKDPSDVTQNVSGLKPKIDQSPEIPFDASDEPEGETPAITEPDDLSEPVDDPFYDPEDEPLSGISSDDPTYSDKDAYWKKKNNELTEGNINIDFLKQSYKAILKSKVTLDDILKSYNNMPWSSSYGGKRWGDGTAALIRLLEVSKSRDLEEINKIIDHIYDLQHNSGSLLNKGPMYVDDTDLNRRFKFTDIARFIPFVSPLVKNLILRYHSYTRPDKIKADTETNMESLLKSPLVSMSSEESAVLTKMGFAASGNGYQVQINFINKKKQEVHGVYYQINKHQVGSFTNNGSFQSAEGEPIKYVVSDNYRSDVKAFDKFDDAVTYLKNYQRDMKPSSSPYVKSSNIHAPDKKQQYLTSHTKIRLPVDKEQELLNIGLFWRPLNRYYKAQMPSDEKFALYAFTDGTFLAGMKHISEHLIFATWEAAFNYCKAINNIVPIPTSLKQSLQADIDSIKAGHQSHSSVTPVESSKYFLEDAEIAQLSELVKDNLPHSPQLDYAVQIATNGMAVVVKKKYHVGTVIFRVGKNIDSTYGKAYKVKTYTGGEKLFNSWNETLTFIEEHLEMLTGSKPTSSVTATAYTDTPLPAVSTTNSAYSAHVGIHKSPEMTIRLTQKDEDNLKIIGFEPKMVGNKIVYVHLNTGDSVKFWPNNTSKLLFGTSKMNIGLNKEIPEMLLWLPTKYNATIVKSPFSTGATVAQPLLPSSTINLPQGAGVPAGVLFSNDIKAAGFEWNPETHMYVNKPKETTIKIAPNRTSVLKYTPVDYTIPAFEKHFKNLVDLVTYLKINYPKPSPTT